MDFFMCFFWTMLFMSFVLNDVQGLIPGPDFFDAYYRANEVLLVDGNLQGVVDFYSDDNPRFCRLDCVFGKDEVSNALAPFAFLVDDAKYNLVDIVADDGLFLVDWFVTATSGQCTDNFFGSHFGYINEDGLITEFYAIFRPTNVALLQQIQELLECGANTNNDDDSSDDSDGD